MEVTRNNTCTWYVHPNSLAKCLRAIEESEFSTLLSVVPYKYRLPKLEIKHRATVKYGNPEPQTLIEASQDLYVDQYLVLYKND